MFPEFSFFSESALNMNLPFLNGVEMKEFAAALFRSVTPQLAPLVFRQLFDYDTWTYTYVCTLNTHLHIRINSQPNTYIFNDLYWNLNVSDFG